MRSEDTLTSVFSFFILFHEKWYKNHVVKEKKYKKIVLQRENFVKPRYFGRECV